MPRKTIVADAPPAYEAGNAFLVRIHAIERSRGVLIPGHRFEAFRDPGLHPWKLGLSEVSGKALGLRRIALSFKDATLFYMLLGSDQVPFVLGLEDPKNHEAYLSAGKEHPDFIVRIAAFDLSELYAREGLASGDYLLFRFLDAQGRRFSVEGLPAASIDASDRARSFSSMEEGFRTAMAALLMPGPNSELLRAAMLAAPPQLRSDPKTSLSEFVAEGGLLGMSSFGGAEFLWEKGVDVASLSASGGNKGRKGGGGRPDSGTEDGTSELDGLLEEMGITVDSIEVEAFMRDELYQGNPSIIAAATAVERCFAGLDAVGYSQAELRRARSLAVAHALEIVPVYDFLADRKVGPLRSKCLEMYGRFLLWMRETGVAGMDMRSLRPEAFDTLMEIMAEMVAYLAVMNEPAAFPKKELTSVAKTMPALEMLVDTLLYDLSIAGAKKQGGMPGAPAPRSGRGKGSGGKATGRAKAGAKARPASDKSYVLDVRIAGIDPPVWRQLVVPGNRTLAELHRVLQIAFGWTDSHLHVFTLRGERYGKPSREDFEPLLDEAKFTLDELGLRGRSHLNYEYDFGDGWVHDILVLSSSKRQEDGERVDLLDGSRAAPPEDCGGVPGYEDILEILARMPGKRTEEEREFLAWTDGWDPERFRLVEVRLELGRL
ncbi:MAG: plasmid pRiA4b ORF-3 family protein [Rectinemataceae bacterium]